MARNLAKLAKSIVENLNLKNVLCEMVAASGLVDSVTGVCVRILYHGQRPVVMMTCVSRGDVEKLTSKLDFEVSESNVLEVWWRSSEWEERYHNDVLDGLEQMWRNAVVDVDDGCEDDPMLGAINEVLRRVFGGLRSIDGRDVVLYSESGRGFRSRLRKVGLTWPSYGRWWYAGVRRVSWEYQFATDGSFMYAIGARIRWARLGEVGWSDSGLRVKGLVQQVKISNGLIYIVTRLSDGTRALAEIVRSGSGFRMRNIKTFDSNIYLVDVNSDEMLLWDMNDLTAICDEGIERKLRLKDVGGMPAQDVCSQKVLVPVLSLDSVSRGVAVVDTRLGAIVGSVNHNLIVLSRSAKFDGSYALTSWSKSSCVVKIEWREGSLLVVPTKIPPCRCACEYGDFLALNMWDSDPGRVVLVDVESGDVVDEIWLPVEGVKIFSCDDYIIILGVTKYKYDIVYTWKPTLSQVLRCSS